MKPFRPIFGGLTAAIVVVILTVAIVACTLVLGIVPAAMEVLTHTEEHVSPGPPSNVQVASNDYQ